MKLKNAIKFFKNNNGVASITMHWGTRWSTFTANEFTLKLGEFDKKLKCITFYTDQYTYCLCGSKYKGIPLKIKKGEKKKDYLDKKDIDDFYEKLKMMVHGLGIEIPEEKRIGGVTTDITIQSLGDDTIVLDFSEIHPCLSCIEIDTKNKTVDIRGWELLDPCPLYFK